MTTNARTSNGKTELICTTACRSQAATSARLCWWPASARRAMCCRRGRYRRRRRRSNTKTFQIQKSKSWIHRRRGRHWFLLSTPPLACNSPCSLACRLGGGCGGGGCRRERIGNILVWVWRSKFAFRRHGNVGWVYAHGERMLGVASALEACFAQADGRADRTVETSANDRARSGGSAP